MNESTKKKSANQSLGAFGEDKVSEYLLAQNYEISESEPQK
jgi:hypothetical protein